MSRHFYPLLAAVLSCVILLTSNGVFAQQTAFTYQGRLTDGNAAASGLYDFQFLLDTDASGLTNLTAFSTNGVVVSNGTFTTLVDFGPGTFYGSNYWLQLNVRTNGAANFTALSPLQPITPTPHALFADSASNVLGTLQSSQLTGTIQTSQLPSGLVTNGAGSLKLSGSFSGDATGLTNIPVESFVLCENTGSVPLTNTAPDSQEIAFQTNGVNYGLVKGWTFTNNTTRFFSEQGGTYLVQYSVLAAATNSSTSCLLQLELDGNIVHQSRAAMTIDPNSTVELNRAVLVRIPSSKTSHYISLILGGDIGLVLKGGAPDSPSATIMITQIE
jgi:hypothetical protein